MPRRRKELKFEDGKPNEKCITQKVYMGSLPGDSFEIGSNDFNDVFGRFFGRLGIPGHVIADMVLHELGHKRVDSAAGGGEAL